MEPQTVTTAVRLCCSVAGRHYDMQLTEIAFPACYRHSYCTKQAVRRAHIQGSVVDRLALEGCSPCSRPNGGLQSVEPAQWKGSLGRPQIHMETASVSSRPLSTSNAAVFSISCSHTPKCNFSSTVYPHSCWCIIQVLSR
jgi:hypothetical protein